MSNKESGLAIFGYKKSNWTEEVGSYKLQLNPTELDVSISGLRDGQKKEKDAKGDGLSKRPPLYTARTLSLKFTIDATGVVPNNPDGYSILASITKLEIATTKKNAKSHRPPFVKVQWGEFKFCGVVENYGFKYTYFSMNGDPLRAEITMTIKNTKRSDKHLEQSPDITKMPIVKDGDTTVSLCEEYYDDKKILY